VAILGILSATFLSGLSIATTTTMSTDERATAESLVHSKLDTAARVLGDNNQKNDGSAVNSLEAFINQVEAQLGKKIPVEDRLLLIEKAREIIDRLSE
jgi:hypothetical protein